jgi:hypothetical protein
MTAKQQAIKALNQLSRSIQCIERPAFQAKHKDYLATELQAFSLAHGINLLPIGYNPPGEGVAISGASENSNQFPLPSKNSQCASNLGSTVRYITGVTTLYSDGTVSHEARPVAVGHSKAVEASISSGERQESSRSVIEAPGAKEGHKLAELKLAEIHLRGQPIIQNRMGGEAAEEFTARQHTFRVDAPREEERVETEMTPFSDPGPLVTIPDKWPKEARVSVLGPTLNPRLCLGAILEEGDRMGRKVSVWKGRHFLKTGAILKCKLDLVQGDDARYLPI